MRSFQKSALTLSLLALLAAPLAAGAAGDVKVAVASTFTTMDPYDANDMLSQNAVRSFYEGLFRLDRNMKLVPLLAESYTVSDGGLT